jgi:acetylornithine deacetylase/succinyl-diaminopimelate desuccinylase-like protein
MLRRPFLPICMILSFILTTFSALALASSASAQTTPGIPSPASAPNMGTLPQESVAWLEGLIRINTTNPPGNELAAANYIAAILEKEGIPHEVIEITPGRGIVIGRLNASVMPDASRSLLLLAHLDVVGVTREKWTVDPFAAVTQNGYLYGRGTIDDKSMVIANLAAIIALKRNAVPLQRDVIFLADDDEEQGGDASIKAVIAKHWDKIAAGFAINEEGRVIAKNGKPLYVGIQTSEKVSMNVTVICTGTSGHASMPRPDNAVIHLSQAIAKIGDYETPIKFIPETERFFEQLARVEDDETAKWIRALEQPSRQSLAVKRVSEMNPAWNSMMRDTIAPTMLEAGVRLNVIPSEARANLNIRLLPGDSINDVLADLKKVVNDPQIRFEIVGNGGTPSPPSSLESPLYKTIQLASEQEFPGIVTMPYMSTGATDSAQLRLHNVQAYGLLPFPLAEEDVLRMHADDERIPLDSFRKGVEFLYRIVNDFVARR